MGTLVQIARVCKTWTLRALARQANDYDATAISVLEELAAAVSERGSPAAAEASVALKAAARTQSLSNAAAVLLPVVRALP
jgi:hypothetical protein